MGLWPGGGDAETLRAGGWLGPHLNRMPAHLGPRHPNIRKADRSSGFQSLPLNSPHCHFARIQHDRQKGAEALKARVWNPCEPGVTQELPPRALVGFRYGVGQSPAETAVACCCRSRGSDPGTVLLLSVATRDGRLGTLLSSPHLVPRENRGTGCEEQRTPGSQKASCPRKAVQVPDPRLEAPGERPGAGATAVLDPKSAL